MKPARGPAEHFDDVVFATHADQTLKILSDATPAEKRILSAFPYHQNEAVLHTDTRLLPTQPRAWASWNYHIPRSLEQAVAVTYNLSRLQNHASDVPVLLTLNATHEIDDAKVLRSFNYAHPAYSRQSLLAQKQFHDISGQRGTHFCGCVLGLRIHEDGVNSALAVTSRFGIDLDACTATSTRDSLRIAAVSR